MNENTETAIELGLDLSCLTCLQHIGIDPHIAVFLVIGGSTLGRLAIDFLRLKIKKRKENSDLSKK